MNERRLTYLACPYSHPDPEVRAARFAAANVAAGLLTREGHLVFSPISHSHPIAEACELPLGWEFWQSFDEAFLAISERVIVLTLEGWRDSVVVTAEIKIAQMFEVPITYARLERGTLVYVEAESLMCPKMPQL